MAKGVRLKDIKRKKAKGRVYLYRVVRGKFVRLPDLPENHPDFLSAYLEAGNIAPVDNTLSSLAVAFLDSRDFQRRKSTTQKVWRRRIDQIRKLYGKSPVDRLETQHINKALRKLTPGAARSERTIWRAIMSFAVTEGWRHNNPAKDAVIGKMKATPHGTWTRGEIATFRNYWPVGSNERQAFEVLLWTGTRCVDAVAIGWQKVTDGVLEFRQEKTGGTAAVPITVDVPAELENDRRAFLDCAGPEMLFITVGRGRARSVKGLSQFVSKSAKLAGVTGKTAHGLRKARAVALAEAGWTPHKIGAWLGHESLSEVAHYTREANKRALVSGKPEGKPMEIEEATQPKPLLRIEK